MSSIPSSISGKCVAVPIVAGVGNALMAVPLVRQLKTRAGAGEVVVVARTNAMAEPFRRLGEVDRVLVTGGGGKNLVKGILATRALRADAYVVPFPSNRWQYSLLAGASGARRKVLHSYPVGRWRTLAFAVGERTPGVRGIHDVVQNLNLLRMFGVEPDVSEAPLFALREDDRAAAGRLLESAGVVGSFAAVHAGSARTILAKAKRWPTEKYAQLVQRLISDVVSQVVILEGPDEAGVAGSILQNAQAELGQPGGGAKVIKLAGPLGEAAALLERAAFYVGSDSGLAHLAASVGTRAATIFAPADP